MFFVQPYDCDCYEFDEISDAVDSAWKKLDEDERKAIIDAYDKFDPEDKEHYFFDDWIEDNWKTYLSDYINEVVEDENCFVMGIPSYALCYLIYGESDNLSEEDIKNIDSWVEKMQNDNNGKSFDISPISGRGEYFDPVPCFGLPCESIDCWIIYAKE